MPASVLPNHDECKVKRITQSAVLQYILISRMDDHSRYAVCRRYIEVGLQDSTHARINVMLHCSTRAELVVIRVHPFQADNCRSRGRPENITQIPDFGPNSRSSSNRRGVRAATRRPALQEMCIY